MPLVELSVSKWPTCVPFWIMLFKVERMLYQMLLEYNQSLLAHKHFANIRLMRSCFFAFSPS